MKMKTRIIRLYKQLASIPWLAALLLASTQHGFSDWSSVFLGVIWFGVWMEDRKEK